MERIGEWSDRKITLAQMTCDAGLFDLLQCLSQWLKLSLLYLEMSFTAWESKERVIGLTGFKTWEVFFKIALHALCFYNLRNKYEQILVKTIEFLVVN